VGGMRGTGLSQLLRGALGVAGGLGFLLALAVIAAGEPVGAAWLLIASAALLLIALYEQARYRGHAEEGGGAAPSSAPGWARPLPGAAAAPGIGRYQRTDEVFDDPTTGRRLRVWFDPVTGERRYLPES
jgi:hypothetical protein